MNVTSGIQNLLETSQDVKINNLKKLNLTSSDLDDSVRIITDWFVQQPHLPKIVPDKRKVENIYISCKGSIERSKLCLDNYYSLKNTSSEVFLNRDPLLPEIRDASEGVRFAFINKLTPEGARVACLQCLDPNIYNPIYYMKYAFMTYDLRMLHDNGCDCVFLFDLNNFKMGHLTKTTPSVIKLILTAAQEAYVARIKGMHFVNVPSYAEAVINLIKSMLSEKIRSRIFIYKTYEDLHKVIDKQLLPKDFGGELRTMEEIQGNWYKQLVENRDWFLEEDKYKSDERRRPGKAVLNELLGTHGSFRKLDVD